MGDPREVSKGHRNLEETGQEVPGLIWVEGAGEQAMGGCGAEWEKVWFVLECQDGEVEEVDELAAFG